MLKFLNLAAEKNHNRPILSWAMNNGTHLYATDGYRLHYFEDYPDFLGELILLENSYLEDFDLIKNTKRPDLSFYANKVDELTNQICLSEQDAKELASFLKSCNKKGHITFKVEADYLIFKQEMKEFKINIASDNDDVEITLNAKYLSEAIVPKNSLMIRHSTDLDKYPFLYIHNITCGGQAIVMKVSVNK